MKSKIKAFFTKVRLGIVAVVAVVLGFLGLGNVEGAAPTVTDTVSWSHPAQYVDGTALPPAQIARTIVVWGTQAGGPYTAGTQNVPYPGTSVALVRSDPGYGTRCYKAATVLVSGAQSDYSTEVCKTVVAPPNAPSNLTVN